MVDPKAVRPNDMLPNYCTTYLAFWQVQHSVLAGQYCACFFHACTEKHSHQGQLDGKYLIVPCAIENLSRDLFGLLFVLAESRILSQAYSSESFIFLRAIHLVFAQGTTGLIFVSLSKNTPAHC